MRIKFKRANRAVLVDEDFTEEEKAFWRLVFESEEMNRKNVIFVPNDEKAEKLRNLFENLAEAMSNQEVRIVRKLPGHGEGPLDTMNCATVSLKGKSIVFTQEHYGFLRYTDIFEATTRLDKLVQMNFQVNDFDDERRIDCEKEYY
jgi:hypothetical protein